MANDHKSIVINFCVVICVLTLCFFSCFKLNKTNKIEGKNEYSY